MRRESLKQRGAPHHYDQKLRDGAKVHARLFEAHLRIFHHRARFHKLSVNLKRLVNVPA
jgi:hypothetical protein